VHSSAPPPAACPTLTPIPAPTRTAALRARGLVPSADLSAQEAVRDAALAAAVPPPEAADDGAPSAAQLISAGWRRRASLSPDDSGVALDGDESQNHRRVAMLCPAAHTNMYECT
jgi:hypothetical protein